MAATASDHRVATVRGACGRTRNEGGRAGVSAYGADAAVAVQAGRSTRRREVLRRLGVVTLALLAGCLGSESAVRPGAGQDDTVVPAGRYSYEFGSGYSDYLETVERDGETVRWDDDAAIRYVNVFPSDDGGPAHVDLYQEITLVEPDDVETREGDGPLYVMRPNLPASVERPWDGTSDTGSWWHLHWRATDEIQGVYAAVKLAGEYGCERAPIARFGLTTEDAAALRTARPHTYTVRIVGVAPEDVVRTTDGPHADFGYGFVEVAIHDPTTGECADIPNGIGAAAYVIRGVNWEHVFDTPVAWAAVPRLAEERRE